MTDRQSSRVPSTGFGWLSSTASRWILAIVLLLVATLVGASWTLGLFTSSSANPKNTVSAGSMTQDNSAGQHRHHEGCRHGPGRRRRRARPRSRTSARRSGDFTLRVKDVTDEVGPDGGVLSSWLHLDVYDDDHPDAIWAGPLAELDVDLGTWTPGEQRTYRFEVSLPEEGASVDNAFQRSKATATFVWNAVQSR